MRIHCLTGMPDRETALALADFEKEFTYPLGPGRSFSISHDPDYSLFFRCMGEARIYLAESSGNIVGALTVVRRTAVLADGSMLPVVYLCDTKVASAHRGRTVLGRLALKARDETMGDGYQAAYSVVMSGSIPTDQHTGRLGIPSFKVIGRLAILRFDTRAGFHPVAGLSSDPRGSCHRLLAGNASLVSEIEPCHLQVDGARGRIVDTRKGKRLWHSDGHEMVSAHLTGVHFDSDRALCDLIATAVERAGKMGIPGLFLSLPAEQPALGAIIESAMLPPTVAQATVFGTGLPEGQWMVDTSEI